MKKFWGVSEIQTRKNGEFCLSGVMTDPHSWPKGHFGI